MQLVGASYHLIATLLVLITSLNAAVYLRLNVSSTRSNLCIRGDVGLISTSIQVQSRVTQGTLTVSDWNTLTVVDPKQGFNETLDIPFDESSTDGIQLRLLQLEHGGGNCNCWKMDDAIIVMGNSSTSIDYCSGTVTGSTFPVVFCDGTATEARGIISQVVQLPLSETSSNTCPGDSSALIKTKENPLPEICTTPRIEMFYALLVQFGQCCSGPVGEEESIELSTRTELSEVWIPLMLTERRQSGQNDIAKRVVRGYNVKVYRLSIDTIAFARKMNICGEALLPANASEVQFRWVNTATASGTYKLWAIASATANFINSSGNTIRIFNANDDSTSPWQAIRNGGINCTMCDGLPCVLTYFGNSPMNSMGAQTNIALTKAISIIPSATSTETSTSVPSAETTTISNVMNSTSAFSAETSTGASSAETNTGASSAKTSTGAPTSTGASSVETSTSGPSAETSNPSSFAILNRLDSILDEFNITNRDLGIKLVELALEVSIDEGNSVLEIFPDGIGSSLFSLVDRLALVAFQDEDNHTIANKTIFIKTHLISADVEGSITTINSNDYRSDLPLMSIEIPSELVGLFAGSSGGDERVVRVISALYYNVDHLFPHGENSSVLGSGVVSTGLQCENSLCDTTSIDLSSPVIITIEHSEKAPDIIAECVFWEFIMPFTENTSLTRGQWSNHGCDLSTALSNDSFTVCECYHLTHFAILLSPVPLKLDPTIKLSLQLIGYIGVAVSVVTMTLTIIIFISIKSLHNMRNYIHIHLSINLMIAQLIFVVGIDKSAEDHVPVHCQVIAVLLHYFFLVSFMWMLMEGVVLYVALVVVFAKHKKLYILGFTIASYGIPLLYMGLTLPLGFSMKVKHYGYSIACFLKPGTYFIWAFIAPVIVIIVMNFVLFLIVARVMWKHQKRRTDKSKVANVRRWLRSAVFLVIVMGITWIVGVLVMEVEALFPLAYIFTIMVAFQGVAVFLIFVPFSRQVREAFKKLWKVQVSNSAVLTKHFGEKTLKSRSGDSRAVASMKRDSSTSEKKAVCTSPEEYKPANNGAITKTHSSSDIHHKQDNDDCSLEECKINEKISVRDTDDQENHLQRNFTVISNQFIVAFHASSEC